jgi:hypothetical protein
MFKTTFEGWQRTLGMMMAWKQKQKEMGRKQWKSLMSNLVDQGDITKIRYSATLSNQ